MEGVREVWERFRPGAQVPDPAADPAQRCRIRLEGQVMNRLSAPEDCAEAALYVGRI